MNQNCHNWCHNNCWLIAMEFVGKCFDFNGWNVVNGIDMKNTVQQIQKNGLCLETIQVDSFLHWNALKLCKICCIKNEKMSGNLVTKWRRMLPYCWLQSEAFLESQIAKQHFIWHFSSCLLFFMFAVILFSPWPWIPSFNVSLKCNVLLLHLIGWRELWMMFCCAPVIVIPVPVFCF